jgi:hypothetical protein
MRVRSFVNLQLVVRSHAGGVELGERVGCSSRRRCCLSGAEAAIALDAGGYETACQWNDDDDDEGEGPWFGCVPWWLLRDGRCSARQRAAGAAEALRGRTCSFSSSPKAACASEKFRE